VLACVVALLAGGCASVPDTEFLKRNQAPASAEFKNAWGPIPERTSAAIVARLKERAGNLDILDRQIAIEQAVVGRPLVLGNHVALLQDGPATYDAMFAAIRQAKQTINVESYIIEDGEVGQKFADALLERRAAGVEINVLYDSLGGFLTKKEFFDRLRRTGIRVLEFNPLSPLAPKKLLAANHRDHRKLMIVDGRTAFLGGINIEDVYASAPSTPSSGGGGNSGGSKGKKATKAGWRDTDIQLDGPAVAEFQRLFLQSWEKQHGPPLPPVNYFPPIPPQGHESVRAVGSSPDDKFSAVYLTLM